MARLRGVGKEIIAVSGLYLLAFFVTFKVLSPIQGLFFPEFTSVASLLFLPHGVRVLAAWLLGWRSVIAIVPAIIIAYFSVVEMQVLQPSHLVAVAISAVIAPAVFQALYSLGWKIAPQSDRTPCWPCIMVAGMIISVISSFLLNLAFHSAPEDYFAYLIGDFFGLFFLMLILMFTFRSMRQSKA